MYHYGEDREAAQCLLELNHKLIQSVKAHPGTLQDSDNRALPHAIAEEKSQLRGRAFFEPRLDQQRVGACLSPINESASDIANDAVER